MVANRDKHLEHLEHLGEKIHKKSWVELREKEDAARLREFPAFSDFSDDELHRLVRAAHHDSTSGPWPLIHEQTPSDACYILLNGEVGVYVGRDHVATLGPGEVIGESALRRGTLRSATVTTVGPAEVLRIESEELATLLEDVPAFRKAIDSTIARHTPAAPAHPPAHEEPTRVKIKTSVPTELAHRFEKAASAAGVSIADALEGALNQWIERNS